MSAERRVGHIQQMDDEYIFRNEKSKRLTGGNLDVDSYFGAGYRSSKRL